MDNKVSDIIAYFKKINEIPRCSTNEALLSLWLEHWAEARGFSTQCDRAGNRVICVPATKGYEHAPVVVFQGHMDMVCEKTMDSNHDFSTDPIPVIKDGDWLKAENTTLGADNGIALALALALADDESVVHPPLEFLFTVDEETGLTGVGKLEPGLFKGKMLINIDSEDEGIFVIGCAGGNNTRISIDLAMEALPASAKCHMIRISGIKGGHSGLDIDKGRANACKLMAQALSSVLGETHIRMVSISAGTARNVIPRRAEAVVSCDKKDVPAVIRAITQFQDRIQMDFKEIEPDLDVSIKAIETQSSGVQAVSDDDTEKAVNLLLAMPSGPFHRSVKHPGSVDTSSNFAMISMKGNFLDLVSSQRSSDPFRLDQVSGMVEAVGKLAGGRVDTRKGYPPWLPSKDSELLNRTCSVYEDLFGKKPDIQVMHAGLECAVIGSKYEGMDMISMGPTLENPHSPSERLYIPSIERVWRLLVALLASFKP